MYKQFTIALLGLFMSFRGFGDPLPDSLQNVLNHAGSDTARVRILLAASDQSIGHDADKANDYARAALELSQKRDYPYGVAKSYYSLGMAAYITQSLVTSHTYFLKAAAMFDSMHKSADIAMSYSALADAMAMENNFKNSTEYYKKAQKVFYSLGDSVRAISMDMSIAANLGTMTLYDSALNYSLSVLPAAKKLKDPVLLGRLLGNIGTLCEYDNKLNDALTYLHQSQEYIKKTGDPQYIGLGYYNIGNCYTFLKDYKNAKKNYLVAKDNFEKIHSVRDLISVNGELANMYKELKDYPTAIAYYEKTLQLKDSFATADMNTKVAEMHFRAGSA